MSKRNGYYLDAVRWLKWNRQDRQYMIENRNDTVRFPYEMSFYKTKLYWYRVRIHQMIKHT